MTAGSTSGPGGHAQTELTYKQAILVQGVLPVLIVSVVLPLGLVALFLATASASLRLAVSHGELLLAGGNSSFAGCIVLIAARPDRPITAAIVCTFALIVLVLPSYGLWAYVTVDTLTGRMYATAIAGLAGAAWAVAGIVVSMTMVRYAYQPIKS
ncbi:MAG TPA: hypothetical protein VL979_05065 [Solirubrobacteraceae bacterium]|nr:hypothetical protein [Solirubrobacteraceae bacterium]